MIKDLDNKTTNTLRSSDTRVNGCPVNGKDVASKVIPDEIFKSTSPIVSLRPISKVMESSAKGSPLWKTCEWIRNFLARPHQELGRKGSVCPFIPTSLQTDGLWLAEITDNDLSVDDIGNMFLQYRELFLKTEPVQGAGALNKAFIIVLPKLGENAARIIDEIHGKYKEEFVGMGLMLGEFYMGNQSPGLHNEDFKPMCSPLPVLGIRYMADLDLPFFTRDVIPPLDRIFYLRSYIQSLSGKLSKAKLNRALDALVQAELEVRAQDTLDIPSAQLV